MKSRQQMLKVEPAAHSIAIHAPNARTRKNLREPLFPLLRTRAEIVEMFTCAAWALRRHGATKAAVVALKALTHPRQSSIFCGRLVMRKRNGAVLAFKLLAACAANHRKRIAAAVQKNHRLLAAIEGLARLVDQGARKELLLPRLLKFAAHVDEFHFG